LGWRIIKRSGHEAEPVSAGPNHGYGPNHGKGYDTHDKMNFESDFDKEWNEFMKRNDKKDV
jgi:hypothetical protein